MGQGRVKIAVLGPSGRMGRRVAELIADAPDLELHSLLDHPDSGAAGQRIAGVKVAVSAREALAGADTYIDFTTPASTLIAATAARELGVAAVVGTTGLTDAASEALDSLAEVAPVLWASNFSLGVNLLEALVETAARALQSGYQSTYDAELVEAHHRRKRDAPSGTALTLAEAVARGRGQSLADVGCFARVGEVGARPTGQIGIQTIRGGDIVGDHTVMFIGDRETLELRHRASDRGLFADGAVAAARWLAGRPCGRYTMADVLGLR